MKLCVFGTGYVGLVTAACFADVGHDVLCIDIDRERIDSLRRGEVPIFEPGLAELVIRNSGSGRLSFSTDGAAGVRFGDLIFIAVGTPPDGDGSADLRHVLDVAKTGGQGELVDALAKDVAEMAGQRKNPVGDFKPKGGAAGQEILAELGEANRLVGEKATPEEADAFREWLIRAAQGAADAAKEGGFMGFRAEQVSEGEQRMLERVREVLAPQA